MELRPRNELNPYANTGGAALPSTLLTLSGVVDWGAGATCVAVLDAKVDSTAVTEDTQISGGLWATATGLRFTDGTNVCLLPCSWAAGDRLIVLLTVYADVTMALRRML